MTTEDKAVRVALQLEVSRLRSLLKEAQEQAEQWRRAFLDAEEQRLRLEREAKGREA
jgi:hypothetical protein